MITIHGEIIYIIQEYASGKKASAERQSALSEKHTKRK
jgi:hypothetical protein